MVDTHVHHRGKFADGNKLCQFECFALCLQFVLLLLEPFLHSFTLLLAVFGTFLVLILAGQTGEGLSHLLCHIFLVDLQRPLRTFTSLILVAVFVLVLSSLSLSTALVLSLSALVLAGSSDVDTLFAGVDAVAFDSDPIRGGKIVIQAKRYTNVVGVSAVRDLYGTLINEGAMKGILVTTSYYGNDAYEFAKDKPIQLIDGAGLLGLLQKHGHKARIDLQEAKALLKKDNN